MAIVGIMPLYDDEKDSYWMLPAYMRMLEANNVIPLMLPLTENHWELDYFLAECDGFLLTGGQDVSPSLYGEEALPCCEAASSVRDDMDSYILKNAAEADKAVLGICRGVQLMNACCGGTLYQDLPTQFNGGIKHHMTPPYDRAAHNLQINAASPLYEILNKTEIGVNSCHHQAINKLSPQFKPMAVSDDGLVEAVYMPNRKFVFGVQWHPELSYKSDDNSVKLIQAFVKAMR